LVGWLIVYKFSLITDGLKLQTHEFSLLLEILEHLHTSYAIYFTFYLD